jgi:choline dehydrogenase-like flavoprotein
VGRRTFLHPTIPLAAFYDQPVEGFYGPPQSVSVHQFAHRPDGVGYFIEASPTHPMLSALAFPGTGDAHRRLMERLPFLQATIALLIDGHHDDEGGVVTADGTGRVKVSYPMAPALRDAAVHALGNMARLQLAAGAKEIMTLHESPLVIRGEADIARIAEAPFGPNRHAVFSAHQMGGCAMGEDPRTSVVDSRGRHHELGNVWIVDGSVFPTSLGVNPQLTIYAVASRFSDEILKDFNSRPAR